MVILVLCMDNLEQLIVGCERELTLVLGIEDLLSSGVVEIGWDLPLVNGSDDLEKMQACGASLPLNGRSNGSHDVHTMVWISIGC